MNGIVNTMPPASRRFFGGVDIHSHPLPGIDDGATSIDNSLWMLRLAARYGTNIMVATPHRWYGGRENRPGLLRRLTAEVQAAMALTGLGRHITLIAGQEIPLTLETAAELRRDDVLSIGDQGLYTLVEPPFNSLPEWTTDALAAITAAGIHPVLAHPERNNIVQNDPEIVLPMIEAGALLQVTTMSILGDNGERARDTAQWLLDNHLVTVVASDCHSPTWRPPTLRPAYHALVARYGAQVATALCSDNPRRIALGHKLNEKH